ncbi:MAG: GTPase HflX [Clostridia bacterium]|nr:GTPase HflX [Clostridia bacterium]
MKTESLIEKDGKREVILVAVMEKGADKADREASFDELTRLAETAGAEVYARMVQEKEAPDARTYIGSGKVRELSELCKNGGITMVVFDCELSPSQIKNLENDLGDVQVIDRSMLILDIFALHATSGEGKLQVELAQLKYTVPRLTGHGTELSRLGGGIGTRGPGESKLETDRRHVKRRMDALEASLAELSKNRAVQRSSRDRSGIFKVAIAGYTNAGKSTLLNRLTDAGILAEDKLFATLDPTTRKFALPDGEEILLTDTVGFIRNLPHHLIRAFRSTLDEVCYADALMVVIDASDPESMAQLDVTRTLIGELGAADKPVLFVYNKCDRGIAAHPTTPAEQNIFISAVTGDGTDELVERLSALAKSGKREYIFDFPSDKLGMINMLYTNATVLDVEYTASGASVRAICDGKISGQLARFIRKE